MAPETFAPGLRFVRGKMDKPSESSKSIIAANAFREAHLLTETIRQYCIAGDKVPVSISDIQYAIEQRYSIKVETYFVGLKSDLVRGTFELYDGKAIIYIDANLPKQFARYVCVKEMCHIILKDTECITIDPVKIIEGFVQWDLCDNEAKQDIVSESLAKVAAVELLFPFDLRERARIRLEAGEATIFTIAEWLEIPEWTVEYALSSQHANISRAFLRAA
jgi:Zn-dependent peptidase ImmA (M78 family)